MKLPRLHAKRIAFMLLSTAAMSLLWMFYRSGMTEVKIYSVVGRHANRITHTSPNSDGKNQTLIFSHQPRVEGWESNAAQQLQVSCNTSDYHSELQPIQDFRKYPCVKGLLPVFRDEERDNEGTCVRTFCDTGIKDFSTNKSCVTLRTTRGKTPICTYPAATDIYVSASLQRTGQWEPDLVDNLANFIKTKPNTEFIDLGCNIGVYTLSLAYIGIKVTAIDPLIENLELLSQSLRLGKLSTNVTLIWNAVSNKHKLVKFTKGLRNVGGTQIADASLTSIKNTRSYLASTITLDDLLPAFIGKHVAIKMDIEGSEYNALLGVNKFFEKVDVDVIQMEVSFTKKGPDGINIFHFLTSRGFYPFRDLSKRSSLTNLALPKWPSDVYFMKP